MRRIDRRTKIIKRSANRILAKPLSQRSFTEIEDSDKAAQRIYKIARKAVKKAADENRKHGLAAIIIRGNQVFKAEANTEHEIATLKKQTPQYRIGQVLYARKG